MKSELTIILDAHAAHPDDEKLVDDLTAFAERFEIDYCFTSHVSTLGGIRDFLNTIGYQLIPQRLEQR